MRAVVTCPFTSCLQSAPAAAHIAVPRPLMILGFAKPMVTWYPAGPNSWKKLGSPIRRKKSCAFWPSRVLFWSHSSPFAILSAPGVATTPYLPGIRLATTAWPARGDRVTLSDSYFGQVTIVPVIPVGESGEPTTCREIAEIGHASFVVAASMVPARLFDNGMLN